MSTVADLGDARACAPVLFQWFFSIFMQFMPNNRLAPSGKSWIRHWSRSKETFQWLAFIDYLVNVWQSPSGVVFSNETYCLSVVDVIF